MYNKSLEQLSKKKLSFEQLCTIWNAIQKYNAKMAIRKADRLKTTLTYKEQLNKFAQLGGIVYSGKVFFTTQWGMGLLITPTQKILGATIDDFYKASEQFGDN